MEILYQPPALNDRMFVITCSCTTRFRFNYKEAIAEYTRYDEPTGRMFTMNQPVECLSNAQCVKTDVLSM